MSNKEIIYGKNVIDALLISDVKIDEVFLAKGSKEEKRYEKVFFDRGFKINKKSKQYLDELAKGGNHQGVLAIIDKYNYCEVSDILAEAEKKGEKPFVIILDKIVDVHNLGAIIRTANLVGAHGIVIKKDGGASVNSTVYKTSSGALFSSKIARVTNISRAIKELKSNGLWVYASSMEGGTMYDCDFKDGTALVIGNEGKGVSELVKKNCDMTVSIPMRDTAVDSLNGSVAASVLMYEVFRQRYI